MLEAGAALGERFVLCHYEDLVLRSEPVLRELLDTTVKSHVAHILEALEVSNRTEAVLKLKELGLAAGPANTESCGDRMDAARRAVTGGHAARAGKEP